MSHWRVTAEETESCCPPTQHGKSEAQLFTWPVEQLQAHTMPSLLPEYSCGNSVQQEATGPCSQHWQQPHIDAPCSSSRALQSILWGCVCIPAASQDHSRGRLLAAKGRGEEGRRVIGASHVLCMLHARRAAINVLCLHAHLFVLLQFCQLCYVIWQHISLSRRV